MATPLLAAAVATAVCWLGVEFSIIFSDMVISYKDKYGPIGVVFALMSWFVAIGVVIILGAVAGVVWQERKLSLPSPFKAHTKGGSAEPPSSIWRLSRPGPSVEGPIVDDLKFRAPNRS